MSQLDFSHIKGRPLTGGDLAAISLRSLDVDVAFGVHGGHLDGFLLGAEQSNIRLIDTRHETTAVQAAEGYFKVTGKVGVCFVTANSGFSNGLPGLATAMADRNPVFCITSSQPPNDVDTNGLQGAHDQILIAKPLTKFAHRVTAAEEIPRVVAHAFQVATSGGPGPVLIDIPISLLFAPVSREKIAYGAITSPASYSPAPSIEAISASISLWRTAQRPVIITGSGATNAKCGKLLATVASITNTPVCYKLNYGSCLPFDHPLQAGPATKLAILPSTGKPQPDLIILVGARTGTFLGGRGGFILPTEGCKYVQIDTDGAELGKTRAFDVGIVADPEQVLDAFGRELNRSPFKAPEEWAALVTGLKRLPSQFEDQPGMTEDGRIHPYHALKRLFSSLEPGAVICADGGESAFWALDLMEIAKPHLGMYACGYLGFLGNGWGYALGAAIGSPGRQVINVQGDGSAGFHIAELDTFARFNLNILTVIVNNHVWAMSLHAQDMLYADRIQERPASKLSKGTAYELIGQGFENESAKVTQVEEIEKTVKKMSSIPGPGCINLIVSSSPTHPGLEALVTSGIAPGTMVIPYFG